MEEYKDSGRTQIGPKIGPHYTLIIPFSPAMSKPKLLFNLLKSAGCKAEIEINVEYSKENADFLIKSLREVIKNVKCVPGKKTLAIFISKFAKNVYYFTPTKMLSMPSLLVRKVN